MQFVYLPACLILFLRQVAQLRGNARQNTVSRHLHCQVSHAHFVADYYLNGGVALKVTHVSTVAVLRQLCICVKTNERRVCSDLCFIHHRQGVHSSSFLIGNDAALVFGIGVCICVCRTQIRCRCCCRCAVGVVCICVIYSACLYALYVLGKDAHAIVYYVRLKQIYVAFLRSKLRYSPAALVYLCAG